MGTELVAPLLYSLARSIRAENVLEVGAGTTTPWLVRALHDNRLDVARERDALSAKADRYDPGWMTTAGASAADTGAVLDWLLADPPLVNPQYHDRPYRPRLVSVDDGSSPYAAAEAAWRGIRDTGLGELLDERVTDFRAEAGRLAADRARFDLAWFDCGGHREYRDFLDLYWNLVRPDGGLIVLHYTLTVPSHEQVVTDLVAARGNGSHGDFEVLSLLEPHKLMQNSCTMIRRCVEP